MSRKTLVFSLFVSLLVAGCGEGGSGDPGGPTGAAAGVTRGAITGTGSGEIVVNGVRVSTSGAAVRLEGETGSAAALQPGMVVTVRGSFDDRAGVAQEIEYEHAVKGKVLSKGDGTIVVGGQTVRVDDTTEFGEDNPARLGSVAVGERVRVSGVPDDKGGIRASRVDDSPGSSEDLELKGFVSGLASSGDFTLKLTPDAASGYSVTLATGVVLPAGVQDGSYVEVRSLGPVSGSAIVAASVSLEDRFGTREGRFEVEGIVTSGDSTAFVVDGLGVKTSASTRWQFGVPADLVPGVKVEAQGHLDAAGALVAEKVSYRAVVRLEGPIESVELDAGAGRIQLLGFDVSVSDLTDNRLGALGVGDVVEVRGYPSRTGQILLATRIDEGNGNGRIFLQGVATEEDASARTLVVLGVPVRAEAGASYHDSRGTSGGNGADDVDIGATAFFAAVDPGRTVVKVRGDSPASLDASGFLAEELELEGDE
jgi:hypothetical protein